MSYVCEFGSLCWATVDMSCPPPPVQGDGGRYAQGHAPGLSLRACAGLYGVSLKTSWFMRMRPREVMARACQLFRRGEAVSWQADGTYLSESFKGNRSCSARPMPCGARCGDRLRDRRPLNRGVGPTVYGWAATHMSRKPLGFGAMDCVRVDADPREPMAVCSDPQVLCP